MDQPVFGVAHRNSDIEQSGHFDRGADQPADTVELIALGVQAHAALLGSASCRNGGDDHPVFFQNAVL